ncbi:hypothetical protein FHL15_006879 [Xylaria flabelliformis]|uniref:F-box domain-containing protein n=1 Tax=Xylaria flabelliformis TaxID=2512241 RepID=A0A553HWD4_9PEZI|nr:hypothetical protein FHL15_006879 [Xylaria flabelliformis]
MEDWPKLVVFTNKMNILQLPAEIIRLILSNVEETRDLKTFSEASKAAYEHAAPIGYQSVILKQDQFAPDQPNRDVAALLNQSERSYILQYIRKLCITSDFKSNFDSFRCWNTNEIPNLHLKQLSLNAFPLDSPERLVEFLNVRQLQSLKLRLCPGWSSFLRTLYESGRGVNLKSFELKNSIDLTDDFEEYDISDFLNSFTGLEELYLSVVDPSSPFLLWKAALHHSSSLRRMVYQVRTENVFGDSKYCGEEEDLINLSMRSIKAWKRLTYHLGALDLECLGLTCPPFRLPLLLQPYCQKGTLKVLHVRQSKLDTNRYGSWCFDSHKPESVLPSFQYLVNWVFGPDGICSLQLLAFRDFQYRGRLSSYNLILRRKDAPVADGELPYYRLDPLLERNKSLGDAVCGFLEACPSAPLTGARYYGDDNDDEHLGWQPRYVENDEDYEDDEDDEDDDDDDDEDNDIDDNDSMETDA